MNNKNNNARCKKGIRVKRKIQLQTRGNVSRFETLLYVSAFTKKYFPYVHTGPSTKEPPPRNYNYKSGVHNSTLSNTITSTQEGRQAKKKIITW